MSPQPNMVKISSVTTSQPTTRKQARGGHVRWKLEHLPAGTGKKFTELVVPLAKLKAGTVTPWAGLDQDQVQKIVDDVFGEGEHVVKEGDAWCGLVSIFPFICIRLNIYHIDFVSPQQLAKRICNGSQRGIRPFQEAVCR